MGIFLSSQALRTLGIAVECLVCHTTPNMERCRVFVTMEDDKGEFFLCSVCWKQSNAPDVPLLERAPPKKKRKRKRQVA